MHPYSLYRFQPILLLFLCFHWGNAKVIEKLGSDLGVIRVQVPGFGSDGRLSWELGASEVRPRSKELYEANNPLLKTYDKRGIRTEATSSSGIFDLRRGYASGKDVLLVKGQGFSAKGKSWKWWQKSEKGNHRMVFEERGELSFDMELGKFFLSSVFTESKGCPEEPIKKEKKMLTVARADYLELLTVDEKSHRFLLEGNVSVVGNELRLSCDKMEVKFDKDSNSSSDDFGEISFITALGKIEFAQKGRVSYCDALSMDVSKGEVLLEGSEDMPARVVDEEWGKASGRRIVLEKGKRRARIIGDGADGRPRLELPALPNLGFELKGKAP
jgi:lipopolysaccharide export system protein LptA